jgi:CheY-like chemotaxis protein
MVAALSGTAILMADDDAHTLEVHEDLIADEGATVRSAKSGREAREVLRTWMPDMDGRELLTPSCRRFRVLDTVRHHTQTPLPPTFR